MLGLPAGVWADAGKFIAAQLVAANAVEISSPLIRLLILMISAPYITLPAQHADNRTLSTPRSLSVSFIDASIFAGLPSARYAASAESAIKPFLSTNVEA
jgi:hypothetical protein